MNLDEAIATAKGLEQAASDNVCFVPVAKIEAILTAMQGAKAKADAFDIFIDTIMSLKPHTGKPVPHVDALLDYAKENTALTARVSELERERDEARTAILACGTDQDFDWKILTRIAELEKVVEVAKEWKRLRHLNLHEVATPYTYDQLMRMIYEQRKVLDEALTALATKEASDGK